MYISEDFLQSEADRSDEFFCPAMGMCFQLMATDYETPDNLSA